MAKKKGKLKRLEKDVAVQTSHLYKVFNIPHERKTTLFEALFSRKSTYDELVAINDVSFTVKRGEFLGIIGDNGSGKSTLLKLIANIIRPTSGEIEINGKVTPFIELGLGFNPEMTARENVYIYGTILGIKKKEIEKYIERIFNFAELERFSETKLKNFSSGMHVRLAFATAIQVKPEILLVDEILAVGDMDFKKRCYEVFDRFKDEGVTLLYVSHDMETVRKYCEKTILLKNGRQVMYGRTKDVIENYVRLK